MKRSKEMAIYHRRRVELQNGKIVKTVKPESVRVMVRAEGYAMVRRLPAAMPFVVSEKDLSADDSGRA